MLDHTIKERNNLKVEFTVQSTKYVQMLLKWGCNSEKGSSFLFLARPLNLAAMSDLRSGV